MLSEIFVKKALIDFAELHCSEREREYQGDSRNNFSRHKSWLATARRLPSTGSAKNINQNELQVATDLDKQLVWTRSAIIDIIWLLMTKLIWGCCVLLLISFASLRFMGQVFSQHDALCFSTSFEIGPNQSDYFLKLHLIQESITKVFQDILPLFPKHSPEAKLINICPGNILIFVEVIW